MGKLRLNGRSMDASSLSQAAAGLLRVMPALDLPSEIEDFLDSEAARGGAWIVLCSGGADSVALLLWLWAAFPERRADLRVLHVNHGTRGVESDRDAAFVSELSVALELWVRIATKAGSVNEKSEDVLRGYRDEALAFLCAREPVAAVFTGHQADDVAENLLFRLGRGAGLSGLGGLRPVQFLSGKPPRIRPLLHRRRAVIRALLSELGVPWREDQSNTSDDYTRNRLRSLVMPKWEASMGGHDPVQGALRSHRHLREAEEAIEAWTSQFLLNTDDESLPLVPLRELPLAVRRRVLERWWQQQLPGRRILSDDAGQRMLQWVEEGSAESFSVQDALVSCDGSRLTLAIDSRDVPPLLALGERQWNLPPDSALNLPTGDTLGSTWRKLDESLRDLICGGSVSCHREVFLALGEGSVVVRGWKPGDRYRPLGAIGRKKLQDAFTDAGIPRARRHVLPVVCSPAGAVLWVPGLPPAEECRIGADTTRALWLTYSES